MKIAAICCTYRRPELLAEMLECFLRQDYPNKELVVLDDAGQYARQDFPDVKFVSVRQRFRTVGEKRNATAALASSDVDAYAVFDDDDIYLPWHLTSLVSSLEQHDLVVPSKILLTDGESMWCKENPKLFYHAAWGFTRNAFEQAGGYPFIQSGQDQGLLERMKPHASIGDCTAAFAPSFIYRVPTNKRQHLSTSGPNGYELMGSGDAENVEGQLQPFWSRDWVHAAQT